MQQAIDRVIIESIIPKNKRLGLVTNDAAMTADGKPSRLALLQSGHNLVMLFSPEHGLSATGADGEFQQNRIDELTRLPVISLYGESLSPNEESTAAIDILLFDIPDVGSRFYTYLWTMTLVMEFCAASNMPLIILDRSNPIGGNLENAEGPLLDETHCSSFIGRWNIPVRHCCTLGELANYFSAHRIHGLDLTIIRIPHWNRQTIKLDQSTDFIPTSPAIRDLETAMLYPGTGLLEGINVNEGRGTSQPFKIFGAPWINEEELQTAFNEFQHPGVETSTARFQPAEGLYKNEYCGGLQLKVTNAGQFRPVSFGIQLIHLLQTLYPAHCKERSYPTRANPSGLNHLDRLTGVYHSFEKLKSGALSVQDTVVNDWASIITPYLLYAAGPHTP